MDQYEEKKEGHLWSYYAGVLFCKEN